MEQAAYLSTQCVYLSVSDALSPKEAFHPIQCSYSSRLSRCWCTLDHNEDEMRAGHFASLCVTSIAGNVTSNLLDFTPMGIRKWMCHEREGSVCGTLGDLSIEIQ